MLCGGAVKFLTGEIVETPFQRPPIVCLTGAPDFIPRRPADYHQSEERGERKWLPPHPLFAFEDYKAENANSTPH